MNSALDDLILVIDWLAATKTPHGPVADALDRLHKRAHANIPMDVKVDDFQFKRPNEPFKRDGDI